MPKFQLERTSNPRGYDIRTPSVHFITCMTRALEEMEWVLVMLFISVFEYTYFFFKSVFEYLLHSLPWPYFHIYIYISFGSQQVFGTVAGDFS